MAAKETVKNLLKHLIRIQNNLAEIVIRHTGKCIRRFAGIYAYCRYLVGIFIFGGVNTI